MLCLYMIRCVCVSVFMCLFFFACLLHVVVVCAWCLLLCVFVLSVLVLGLIVLRCFCLYDVSFVFFCVVVVLFGLPHV